MNQDVLRSITQEIYRRFPEVKGAVPQVRQQPGAPRDSATQIYLLTYQSRVKTADQKTLVRRVRVTVNEQGKMLKVSTSR